MTQNQIKTKLKALSTPGVPAVICDLLQVIGLEIEEDDITEVEYARAAKRIISNLKTQYIEQLKVEQIIPRQRDLEDIIFEIKQEEMYGKRKDS